MTELTPDERQKIFLEEKTRIDAQEQAKSEIEAQKKKESQKKTQQGCVRCLGLGLGLVVVLFVLNYVFCSGEHRDSTIYIKANVQFSALQCQVRNDDSFDWNNVKMKVNSNYNLVIPKLSAGQTFTVGAMQFAKSDGTRFNPLMMKPQNVSIFCDTPAGQGFYYGTWK